MSGKKEGEKRMNVIITSTNLSGVGWFTRVLSKLHKEMFGTPIRWQYEVPRSAILSKRRPILRGWLNTFDADPQKLVEKGYDKVICLHRPFEDLLDSWKWFKKRIPIKTRLLMEPRYTEYLKRRWQCYEDNTFKHPNYIKLWLPDLNNFAVREYNRVMDFLGWRSNIKSLSVLDWCMNYNSDSMMCEFQECGKCMSFKPKKNRPFIVPVKVVEKDWDTFGTYMFCDVKLNLSFWRGKK